MSFLVHLHTGHERTIEKFITSMERSGYALLGFAAYTQTNTRMLKFQRPSYT